MNADTATLRGIRVPRLPRPDPMRLALYAQIPVCAVLFAGALNPHGLPVAAPLIGMIASLISGGAMIVARRGSIVRRPPRGQAVTFLLQSACQLMLMGSMMIGARDVHVFTRGCWIFIALVTLFNITTGLANGRR